VKDLSPSILVSELRERFVKESDIGKKRKIQETSVRLVLGDGKGEVLDRTKQLSEYINAEKEIKKDSEGNSILMFKNLG